MMTVGLRHSFKSHNSNEHLLQQQTTQVVLQTAKSSARKMKEKRREPREIMGST